MLRYRPNCEITIWTPTELGVMAEVYGDPSSVPGADFDPAAQAYSVNVVKHIAQAAGTFTITLSPAIIKDGKRWDELVPLLSLVRIRQNRPPFEPDPVNTMIGIVESVQFVEEYGAAATTRRVVLAGREASAILLNHQVYFFPTTDAASQTTFGADAWAAARFNINLISRFAPPQEAMDEIITEYVSKIDLRLGRFEGSATDLIRFDSKTAVLFDPIAKYLLAGTFEGQAPLWSILQQFSDPAFQEFFPRTHPTEDAVDLVFRAKPFLQAPDDVAGAHADGLFQARLTDGGDPTAVATHYLPGNRLISESTSRSLREAFAAYWVLPAMTSYLGTTNLREVIKPIIDTDPDSPSYVDKLGLRTLEVAAKYFPLADEKGRPLQDVAGGASDALDIVGDNAQAWAKILRGWYRWNPLFFAGAVRCAGMGSLRVGDRLLVSRPKGARYPAREYYIEGVQTNYAFGTGAFHASLAVTRGWDVSEEVPAEAWGDEGGL